LEWTYIQTLRGLQVKEEVRRFWKFSLLLAMLAGLLLAAPAWATTNMQLTGQT
jgi:hypothetical protein